MNHLQKKKIVRLLIEIKLNIEIKDSCSPNGIIAECEGKQRHKSSSSQDLMEMNVLINVHECSLYRVLTSSNVDDVQRTKYDHNSSPCTSFIGELKSWVNKRTIE